ncbi:ABC transporter ATP-binding protein [Brevibacterium daeguense]|uniref:ABC transporter ATP-binding protein n=1 Tax=Brevibacterium daeguense TaxID=909936 RepID=A0ABP8EIY9_9MICO|nr:ABC transporter ATP-binding protein [Brevibacterium daeguense]
MSVQTDVRAADPAIADAIRASEVRFTGFGKTFGTGEAAHTVLADVDFAAAPGEIISILGASGCGKSTLLRAAGGLGPATAGTVTIDGTPVTGIDGRAAVAFQEPRLLPWRTVRRNIELGLPRGTPKAAARDAVDELLELTGMSTKGELRPKQISGGMAQRVSLARALARNPGVLLLDEPFGALDALTRIKMQDLLLDIHRQRPATVLLVTHDVDEALQLSDRIVVLGRRPSEDDGPSTITSIVPVPGQRPRDRADSGLGHLRAELLAHLGVDTHAAAGARSASD